MPKRKSVNKFDAKEIQGEGAFVKVSAVKVQQIRELREGSGEEGFDYFEEGLKLVAAHVVDWNLVDDEGDPLPLPADIPEVIDELTEDEASWIVDRLLGNEKN